jgi:hypothetical protein
MGKRRGRCPYYNNSWLQLLLRLCPTRFTYRFCWWSSV